MRLLLYPPNSKFSSVSRNSSFVFELNAKIVCQPDKMLYSMNERRSINTLRTHDCLQPTHATCFEKHPTEHDTQDDTGIASPGLVSLICSSTDQLLLTAPPTLPIVHTVPGRSPTSTLRHVKVMDLCTAMSDEKSLTIINTSDHENHS